MLQRMEKDVLERTLKYGQAEARCYLSRQENNCPEGIAQIIGVAPPFQTQSSTTVKRGALGTTGTLPQVATPLNLRFPGRTCCFFFL
jgi:hypothetical protein